MTLVRTETRELRRRAGQWLAEKVRTCRWVGRLANNAELRWTAAVLARTQGRVCISVWYTRIYTCRKGTVVCNLMPNCAQTTCMHWAHWWRARVHTMACTVSHHASLPMRPHVVHASGSATWAHACDDDDAGEQSRSWGCHKRQRHACCLCFQESVALPSCWCGPST